MKPDYIGIGAGRCGTTSLHAALMRHPDVAELRRKEIHYWDRRWERRKFRWYSGLFDPDRVAGEITPSYFFVPGVPGRIARRCPDVKLLVLLRNPVDAMWSSYRRMRRRRQTRANSVLDFLDERKGLIDLVERRHYAAHLARWFASFDRGQFWIVQSERLFGGGDLTSLWKFLGVPVKRMKFPWKRKQGGGIPPAERKRLARIFQPFNEELYDLLGERWNW